MMTPAELDEFLAEQRTCRVATVAADGRPHVSALWFAWDGTALWLYSITRSRRWASCGRIHGSRWSSTTGTSTGSCAASSWRGRAAFVGEAPRTGEPCPELDAPERLFAQKYFGLDRDAARRPTRVATADAGLRSLLGLPQDPGMRGRGRRWH